MDSREKYLDWKLETEDEYVGRDRTGAAQARLTRCKRGWLLEVRVMSGHWLQDPSLSDKPKVLQDRADRLIRNGVIRWTRIMEGDTNGGNSTDRVTRCTGAVRSTA